MAFKNPYKFNRDHIKKSDMIGGYGAGRVLIAKQLKEDLKELYFDGVEEYFYQAQDNITPMVSILKETFQTLWDDGRVDYKWTLPDGFVAHLRPEEAVEIEVNPFGGLPISMIARAINPTTRNTTLGVSIIHSVDGFIARELVNRCKYDEKALMTALVDIDDYLLLNSDRPTAGSEESNIIIGGFISHAVIERLDESIMNQLSIETLWKIRDKIIKTLDYKSFPILPRHDGFGAHPNHCKKMQRIHCEIKAELTEAHLLESIIEEITGKKFKRITGDLKASDVLMSQYTIC